MIAKEEFVLFCASLPCPVEAHSRVSAVGAPSATLPLPFFDGEEDEAVVILGSPAGACAVFGASTDPALELLECSGRASTSTPEEGARLSKGTSAGRAEGRG